MKYENLSIKKAIKMIISGQMFLPEIQRNFVWKEEQIENLFDSIILNYPIGALLFWKTSKKNITQNNLVLYEFIRDYHQRDCRDNKKAPEKIATDHDNYFIVLDGQQRLSSLYIALQGSLAFKIKKKWWNTDEAFPKKKLYFNLDCLDNKKQDDDEYIPRFKFYSEASVPKSNLWFKVCDIIDFDTEYEVLQYITQNKLNEKQSKNLFKLFKTINADGDNSALNYYCIEEADLDDVLNIFVRINSSGSYLSKTDLLFSTIVSGWSGGRDKIESLIRELNYKGNSFRFNKDFVMRTCLVLTGAPVNLKISSFKQKTINTIRDNFDRIKTALIKTVKILVDLGFCNDNITSYNALIPVSYYFYKGGFDSKETENGVKKYLVISYLKNIFGVAGNSALSSTRAAIDKVDCSAVPFGTELFKDTVLIGNRKFSMDRSEIENCFYYKKGLYTFFLLTILYPELKLGSIEWHQDHVHPYSAFRTNKLKAIGIKDSATIDLWQYQANTLANLQLLKGKENETKNDKSLIDWCNNGNKVEYIDDDVSKDIRNFDKFFEARKKKMLDKLTELLDSNN